MCKVMRTAWDVRRKAVVNAAMNLKIPFKQNLMADGITVNYVPSCSRPVLFANNKLL